MSRDEKIEDIKKNPNGHRHDFDALMACSMVGGALDASVLEAHNEFAPLGTNGGKRCDTTEGPCSCGAWH